MTFFPIFRYTAKLFDESGPGDAKPLAWVALGSHSLRDELGGLGVEKLWEGLRYALVCRPK
jgi:hypothetical protein